METLEKGVEYVQSQQKDTRIDPSLTEYSWK